MKPALNNSSRNEAFSDAIRVLRACFEGLPTQSEMEALIEDSRVAEQRGYYDPLEDDRLRDNYARYLGIRVSIWAIVQDLKPYYRQFSKAKTTSSPEVLQAFAIAFAGAEIIVKTGEHLIELARKRDIVWKKLDEAEPRYGLKRKSFTRLYRQLTSPFRMRGFYQAVHYFDTNKAVVMEQLDSEWFQPVAKILTSLNLPRVSRGDHLRRYSKFLGFSLRRRRLSSIHNLLFATFEATGSDIAELRIPLVKAIDAPKRVTPNIVERLKPHLQPGDVFITRHDDAMSNLFLPGFWPHGAFYIGGGSDREALGVGFASDGVTNTEQDGVVVLEAKKDGVLLRDLHDTLAIDSFVVLRPKLSSDDITSAINRGLSHAGKLYDFVFDFSVSHRLVCTEVIYRAYHGVGPIRFDLSLKAGRYCLSAEDFLNQSIAKEWFEPVIICNVGNVEWAEGEKAREVLRGSFSARF